MLKALKPRFYCESVSLNLVPARMPRILLVLFVLVLLLQLTAARRCYVKVENGRGRIVCSRW